MKSSVMVLLIQNDLIVLIVSIDPYSHSIDE